MRVTFLAERDIDALGSLLTDSEGEEWMRHMDEMMSESGCYAPGTERDPRAPWNEVEPVECPRCGGGGEYERSADHIIIECRRCEGTGYVTPEDPELEFE